MLIHKKSAIIVIIAILLIVMVIAMLTFMFSLKNVKKSDFLSVKKLSEYVRQDLSDIKIADASIVRSSDVFYTDGEESDGSVLLVKLSATDEQLQKMTDSLTFGDVSVPPGDLRVFEKYGIETDNIEKKGTSWNEYEDKKLFSTTNKPYSMNWYFLNSGTAEDYNVVVIAVLPFQA